VNPRTPRPVKSGKRDREVIATPEQRDPGPGAPARRSISLTRGIVTEGRDPASRFRDLRGSVTPANAGGGESDRLGRTRALVPNLCKEVFDQKTCISMDVDRFGVLRK